MKPPTNHVAPPEDEIETIVLHKVGVAKEWVLYVSTCFESSLLFCMYVALNVCLCVYRLYMRVFFTYVRMCVFLSCSYL